MYRRLVLKLSGQSIAGSAQFGFNSDSLTHLAREVIAARETGVQLAVVVGGGNVFRGNQSEDWGIDRVEADNIGMLGTVINAVLLRGRLAAMGEGGAADDRHPDRQPGRAVHPPASPPAPGEGLDRPARMRERAAVHDDRLPRRPARDRARRRRVARREERGRRGV